LVGLAAGGCATVTTGTTQAITVDSEPQKAECTLTRDGADLGTVMTPSPITIKRHASTVHVTCRKEGYEEARVIMNSRFESTSAGNFLLGGVIGAMVDASSGANSRYDQYVLVRLPELLPADRAAAASRPKPVPTGLPAPITPDSSGSSSSVGQAVAAAPAPAIRFNGEYFGHVDLPGVSNLKPIRVRFVGGKGSGQVDRIRCPRSGTLEIVAADDGKVAGEGTLVGDNSCTLVPVKISGRSDGNNLLLTFDSGTASREFTFDRR
jgi:hypothetical protein